MKAFWKSRTLWVNVATLGLHFAKPFLGIDTIPDVDPQWLAIANIALRAITKKPLGVTDSQ